MKKVKTYLCCFPGFYNTIFEPNTSDELYEQNQDRDDTFPELDDDDLEFDNQGYEITVAKACCSFIETELRNYVQHVVFENVSSPREYNFRNDSINIEVHLTEDNIKNIRQFIYDHEDEFKQYLKDNFTTRSGFISFFSNEMREWQEYTCGFWKWDDNPVHLGSVLEFICQQMEITDEDMYYGTYDKVSVSEFTELRTTQIKCEQCGQWFEGKRSEEHAEYNRLKKLQTRLYKETQGQAPTNVRTFEQLYPDFAWLCNECKCDSQSTD